MSPAFRLRRHRGLRAFVDEDGQVSLSPMRNGVRYRRLKVAWFLNVLVLVGLTSCRRNRIAGGDITTATTSVGADWVSISFAEPMIAKWDMQLIRVETTSSFQVNYAPLGIRLADGSVVAPELELVNNRGERRPLRLVGLIPGKEIQFSSDQIERGSTFSQLTIRSPILLVCSQMSWISYMPQD